MKIFRTSKKVKSTEQTMPMIMNTIISICKNDKVLFKNENTSKISDELKELDMKIKKQNDLLNQSEEIDKNLSTKLNLIDSEIYSLRASLLEELGSEI